MSADNVQLLKTESQPESFEASTKVEKITALWALSESVLGGILHALKLPFRGMIISSAAVILIGMIAKFSNKHGQIIKSTLLVIFIKASISPHSPVTAYLSVFIQGLLGELFFFSKKIRLLSTLLLGISVSLLSGFQRIFVLTLIYGNTLWKTIDDLLNFIAYEWLHLNIVNPIEFSFILIGVYVGMHIIIGFAAGILAYTIPKSVEDKLNEPATPIPLTDQLSTVYNLSKQKKRKWLKTSTLVIFILSTSLIVLSYFYPLSDNTIINDILIMLGRSIIIMLIWFYFLAPLVTKYIKNIFHQRQGEYARDINSILIFLPSLKNLVAASWKRSLNFKGLKRLNSFLIITLVYLLKDN